MTKKFLSLAIAACLMLSVFGLAGCIQTDSGIPTVDVNIDLASKPQLEIYYPNTGLASEVFNDSNNISVKTAKEITGYNVKYSQLGASSSALSMAFLDKTPMNAVKVTKSQFDTLVAKDSLTDLTDGIEQFGPIMKTVISEESWDAVTVNGKILGIPERVSNENVDKTLFFNMNHLQAANITALPTTTAELKTTLETLKAHFASTPSYRPMTFGKYDAYIPSVAASFGLGNQWADVNGELKFYFEQPEMQDYLTYMKGLYSQNLIDPAIPTNEAADAIAKFVQGNASVIACGWSNTVSFLPMASANTINDVVKPIPGLKNAQGEIVNFQTSGLSYIICVPYWAASNGGYVIDWIDKKLGEDSFRKLAIGDEGVHHRFYQGSGYYPINPAFDALSNADKYMTSSNELVYSDYWMARLRKSGNYPDDGYLYKMWSQIQPTSTIATNAIKGLRNPVISAPPIKAYSDVRDTIEVQVETDLRSIICGVVGTDYNACLARWRNNGGNAAKTALNSWYKSK